jgi:hypothetical protein
MDVQQKRQAYAQREAVDQVDAVQTTNHTALNTSPEHKKTQERIDRLGKRVQSNSAPRETMDVTQPVARALREAIVATAKAEVADGRARLMVYFTASVGIGEHPQHTEEMQKLLDGIAAAEGRMETLDKHFPLGS